MTIVFSWWQCNVRSRASRTHWTWPPSVSLVAVPISSPCGWAGTAARGGPAQSSTRTSTRSASSASSSRERRCADRRAAAGTRASGASRRCGCGISLPHRVVHGAEGVVAVDQNVDGVARPGGRGAGNPQLRGCHGGSRTAPRPELRQPPSVMLRGRSVPAHRRPGRRGGRSSPAGCHCGSCLVDVGGGQQRQVGASPGSRSVKGRRRHDLPDSPISGDDGQRPET